MDACPNKIAFSDSKGERKVTFGELKTQILSVASYLTKKGLVKGDSIIIYSENRVFFASMFLGAAHAGIIVSTCSKDLGVREVNFQMIDSKAKIVVTTTDKLSVTTEVVAGLPNGSVLETILFDVEEGDERGVSILTVLNDDRTATPEVKVNAQDLLCLPYSSGTTGLPKGVMLTHHNVVNNTLQYTASLPVTSGDRFIAVLPFTHIYALVVLAIGAVFCQVTTIVMPKFNPVEFLTNVQEHKVTKLHIVPPIVLFLAKHPLIANFDLSSIDAVLSGAAPLGAALGAQLKERFPNIDLLQGYGMTELSPVATVSPPGNTKLDSCGKLVPSTIAKLIDADGNEVKQGERGELCIKGPQVMRGYLGRQDATENCLIDGWMHTGDVGIFDEEGYLFIVDRVKELIKFKGFQVPPAELEGLLLGHPGIADVAVVGLPDEAAGELPLAFVVRAPSAPELSAEDVNKFLEDAGIAHYKRLRGGVRFVATIPKSASGKILRRILREQLAKQE
jgi:acyl-CoA synthetase (AMP-forming)/AMP-acid ligase II